MLTLLKDNFVTSTNFHSVSDNDYYILRGYQDDLYYTVFSFFASFFIKKLNK